MGACLVSLSNTLRVKMKYAYDLVVQDMVRTLVITSCNILMLFKY